jgi:outer membrane protein OmpA-like peptidoglycan-associated protein
MAGGTVVLLGLGACQTTVAPDGTITTIATGTPVVVTTVPDRTLVLTVNFQFDSAYLTPDSAVLLSNVSLSQLRAQSVVQFLAARGVPLANMKAQGFGPLQLLDPGNPASPANRRVEIVATH